VLNSVSDTPTGWKLVYKLYSLWVYLSREQPLPLLPCDSGGSNVPPTYPKW